MTEYLTRPLRLVIDPLPSALPVTADLVRKHCRIDIGDDDVLLESYQRSAITWAEGAMHRSIVARAHAWTLECFPYRGIRLPRGKTQSVSSIEYASGGEMLVLNGPSSSPVGTGYQEDLTDDDGGVVQYPLGSSWPSPDTGSISPVRINFAAGYLSEELPEDILTAVLFAIADLYEIRGTSEMESLDAAGRFAAVRETLISPYCLSRWHAGSYR